MSAPFPYPAQAKKEKHPAIRARLTTGTGLLQQLVYKKRARWPDDPHGT